MKPRQKWNDESDGVKRKLIQRRDWAFLTISWRYNLTCRVRKIKSSRLETVSHKDFFFFSQSICVLSKDIFYCPGGNMSWAKSARRSCSCSNSNNTITHIDHKKVHCDLGGEKSSRSGERYIYRAQRSVWHMDE